MTEHELESLWRGRVDDSLRVYQIAKQQATKALLTRKSDTPHAVTQFAIRKIQRAESVALAEYARVLKIFTDFVVNGKIPNDDWVSPTKSKKAIKGPNPRWPSS